MEFDNTKDFNIIYEVDMTNVKILLEQRKILVDNIKELNGKIRHENSSFLFSK